MAQCVVVSVALVAAAGRQGSALCMACGRITSICCECRQIKRTKRTRGVVDLTGAVLVAASPPSPSQSPPPAASPLSCIPRKTGTPPPRRLGRRSPRSAGRAGWIHCDNAAIISHSLSPTPTPLQLTECPFFQIRGSPSPGKRARCSRARR